MDQILEFLTTQDIRLGHILGMMVMSFFVAIFHTVIFSTLFDFSFNIKLFFIANPAIIAICALIDPRLGLAAFFLIFMSVFLLAFIGILVASVRSKSDSKKEIKNFYSRYQQTPPSKTKQLIALILFLLFLVGSFPYFGYYSLLITFILFLAAIIFLPTNKSRFLKYQGVLPRSKIRSLAMGLVEVEGKAKIINPLKSPVSGKDCVGFYYNIEEISRDDDGSDRYSSVFSKTVCNEFMIEDDSGSIKVNPANLEFLWIKNCTQEHHSGKRYTENLLKEGDEILLIGRASIDANNTPVIEYDSFRKVLVVAPSAAVTDFNTNKPLRHSFIFFTCIYCVFIALVLISPMEIQSNKIIIKKPDWTIFFSSETKEN